MVLEVTKWSSNMRLIPVRAYGRLGETGSNWVSLGRVENICPHQMPLPLYDQWDHEKTRHLHDTFWFCLNVTCLKNNEAEFFLWFKEVGQSDCQGHFHLRWTGQHVDPWMLSLLNLRECFSSSTQEFWLREQRFHTKFSTNFHKPRINYWTYPL